MRMPWNRQPKPVEQPVVQPNRQHDLENTAIAALLVATDDTLPTERRIDAVQVLKDAQDEYKAARKGRAMRLHCATAELHDLERAATAVVDWFGSISPAKNAEICRVDPKLADVLNGVMDAYWAVQVAREEEEMTGPERAAEPWEELLELADDAERILALTDGLPIPEEVRRLARKLSARLFVRGRDARDSQRKANGPVAAAN
ncbi:MAG: hypothetical protein J2P19_28330 [Pseudonocardia sp.]|nr:hypothetical protein [Pseudonocardia sp.]